MRILVLLKPTNARGTKTVYTEFRKHLCSDGFVMVAPELYVRAVCSRKAVKKHRRRMEGLIPTTGTIIFMTLTEKQWDKIEYLVGSKCAQEELIGAKAHVML